MFITQSQVRAHMLTCLVSHHYWCNFVSHLYLFRCTAYQSALMHFDTYLTLTKCTITITVQTCTLITLTDTLQVQKLALFRHCNQLTTETCQFPPTALALCAKSLGMALTVQYTAPHFALLF